MAEMLRSPARSFEDLIVWQKSHDLGYLQDVERSRIDEVARLLTAYIRSVMSSES